jgi:hypothetical protein
MHRTGCFRSGVGSVVLGERALLDLAFFGFFFFFFFAEFDGGSSGKGLPSVVIRSCFKNEGGVEESNDKRSMSNVAIFSSFYLFAENWGVEKRGCGL